MIIRNPEARMGIAVLVASAASVLWAYFIAREIEEPGGLALFIVGAVAMPFFWVLIWKLVLRGLGE